MNSRRKSSGQTLVEFALLLPLFLLIVMALFELGRFVFYYSVLNNAVREGTRTAIVQSDCFLRVGNKCDTNYVDSLTLTCATANSTANKNTCAEIKEKLFNLPELLDGSRTTITINHTVNATDDPIVHIEIVFQFQSIVPGLNLIGNIPIRVESRMLKTPIAKPL
jgi:Flp pilus assembly protein TadG